MYLYRTCIRDTLQYSTRTRISESIPCSLSRRTPSYMRHPAEPAQENSETSKSRILHCPNRNHMNERRCWPVTVKHCTPLRRHMPVIPAPLPSSCSRSRSGSGSRKPERDVVWTASSKLSLVPSTSPINLSCFFPSFIFIAPSSHLPHSLPPPSSLLPSPFSLPSFSLRLLPSLLPSLCGVLVTTIVLSPKSVLCGEKVRRHPLLVVCVTTHDRLHIQLPILPHRTPSSTP